MKSPSKPADESSRLQALRSLDVLDTGAEERFDRLTRLARRVFDVPIALVSLVDENRQWFKSCLGLDATETPRDISFCGHAILGDDIFLIPDAAKDLRFADNPLVVGEPHVRFYAGCPLRHLNGSRLGTLCIIDRQPRVFSAEDLETLKDLAELAESELAAAHLALLDDLTELSNRRGFVALAQHSLNICIREGLAASLVFLDLNDFKLINDRFGHAEGDRALTRFSAQMRATFRESDVLARIGGDEFVAFLTNTAIADARRTVQRFRKAIGSANQTSRLGYGISFSDGIVAAESERDRSIEDLLQRADSLMYEAKQRDSRPAS